MIRASLMLLLVGVAPPVFAMQTLVPTPYPSGASGATPLDPETPETGGPQTLMRDPYPQILGDTAQGNPPIARKHRRQHRIPTIDERKYRVDRHPARQ